MDFYSENPSSSRNCFTLYLVDVRGATVDIDLSYTLWIEQWYPYVDVNRDDYGRKTLTGLTGHMLHFIVNSMGMKYDVVFPNDRQWGTFLPNGSWTGMIGDLTRNVCIKTQYARSLWITYTLRENSINMRQMNG